MTASMNADRSQRVRRAASPRVVPGANFAGRVIPARGRLLDLAGTPARRPGQVELSPYSAYLRALARIAGT